MLVVLVLVEVSGMLTLVLASPFLGIDLFFRTSFLLQMGLQLGLVMVWFSMLWELVQYNCAVI